MNTETTKDSKEKPLVFVVPLTDGDEEKPQSVKQGDSLGGDREEETIALSHYNISSINVCSRICFAFEELWSVL